MEEKRYNLGLNISRHLLPQISPEVHQKFMKELKDEGVQVLNKTVDISTLKPSQGEFDIGKIKKLVVVGKHPPIIISKDDYILDGHHRWAASVRKRNIQEINVTQIDLPILDLIRKANSFNQTTSKIITNVIKESLNPLNIR